MAEIISTPDDSDEDIQGSLWSDVIPDEILLNIFAAGIKEGGPVPYLCRTARVCRRWYHLSYHPSLWTDVDLSIGWIRRDLSGLQILCETRLYRTISLDLTAWFGMTDQHLQCIVECCKRLRKLMLANCSKLTAEGLTSLIKNCNRLEEIDLSFTSPVVSSHKCLQKLTAELGSSLRRLHLSNVCVDNHFDAVLRHIAVYCKHLTYLDLSHVSPSYMELSMMPVDIEELQHGCPNLEVLLMEKSFFGAKPAPEHVKLCSPGFPKLNRFSAPQKVNTGFLQRMLKTSYNLEKLKMNLEHSDDVQCSGLAMVSLKKLVIHSAMPHQIFVQWHSTLVYLDLSWMTSPIHNDDVDRKMKQIFDIRGRHFVVLRSLLLCGCPVSAYGIRPVFDCCPKLNLLNLNFCPKLPCGWSRVYEGAELLLFKHVLLR